MAAKVTTASAKRAPQRLVLNEGKVRRDQPGSRVLTPGWASWREFAPLRGQLRRDPGALEGDRDTEERHPQSLRRSEGNAWEEGAWMTWGVSEPNGHNVTPVNVGHSTGSCRR